MPDELRNLIQETTNRGDARIPSQHEPEPITTETVVAT
jgi:hypothetical protein